ncbi:MAG: DUF4123 domain-containing protein [Pseudomonadota bacterium]
MVSHIDDDVWTGTTGNAAESGDAAVTVLAVEELPNFVPLAPGETSLSPALANALFGRVTLSDAETEALRGDPGAELGTFAILDGAKIGNLPELLSLSGLEHRCLFPPDKVEELGAVAPWLVRLDAESDLLQALLTDGVPEQTHWARDPAIYIRHRGDLEPLWQHFNAMTRLQDEVGAWHYLRFWDPVVAYTYFHEIRAWPERVETLFGSSRVGAVQIIVPSRTEDPTRRFSLAAPVAGCARPADHRVTARDKHIFRQLQVPKLKQELADWLLRYDAPRFRPFGEARLRALVDHGVAQGNTLSFVYKEEFAYLLYMMSFLGGWFHTSPLYAHISARFETPAVDRHLTVSNAFPGDYRALFQPNVSPDRALIDLNHYLRRRLKERGGWAHVTEEDTDEAVRLFAQASTLKPEAVQAALMEADRESDRLLIQNPVCRGIVRVLWLFLGVRCFEDPLFPWIREILFRDDRIEANLIEVATYGTRRLGRIEAMLRRRNA